MAAENTMSDAKWIQFFDLLKEVVDMPGTYADKRELVSGKADDSGSQAELEEFVSWFLNDSEFDDDDDDSEIDDDDFDSELDEDDDDDDSDDDILSE